MGKITLEHYRVNKFNIKIYFYDRFIIIFRPLLLVIIIFSCVNFLIINQEYFQCYFKYVIKSLAFTSNISLLKEADDYFTANSAINLLLRTGYLAINSSDRFIIDNLFAA